jgi:hypothetical protein
LENFQKKVPVGSRFVKQFGLSVCQKQFLVFKINQKQFLVFKINFVHGNPNPTPIIPPQKSSFFLPKHNHKASRKN